MSDLLIGFVAELRACGIPVSMAEEIDAAAALRHADVGDRHRLKTILGATLVKSARHLEAFDTVFEVYFGSRPPAAGSRDEAVLEADDLTAIGAAGGEPGGELDLDTLVEALYVALRDGDEALAEAVVRQAVRRLAGVEPGRPMGGAYYLHRVLQQLGLALLRRRLLKALGEGATGLERRLAHQEVELRLEQLRRALLAEIRRRLVADRGSEAVARTLRRPPVEDIDLMTATREELGEIERMVHPLARKLATRLSRRRRRGRTGRLEVRRTLRAALSAGGVPADPRFRRPQRGRPEIVLLCDVSGSVAAFARFTLQMVYALASQFSRVQSFVFVEAVDEVTGFFGPGIEFAEAAARVGTEARVVWLDGHSDYGHAFGQFVDRYLERVTPRTTLIITGDARANYRDPNLAALRRIAERCRALFWLNPERARHWDGGDSIMGAYGAVCDGVFEVRTLRHLAGFVERVALPAVRPARRVA